MNADVGPSVRRYKITDQAYDIIKTRILSGSMSPGEEISVDDLANKLNTSKTPIRESLHRLMGERLIVETDRGKMTVVSLPASEIVRICELRAALETLALKWGFDNIPHEVLRKNLGMFQSARKDLEKGDPEPFYAADTVLHAIIVNAPNNQWLAQMISQVQNFIEMTKNMFVSLERYKKSIPEHIRIIESILGGDKRGAARELDLHLTHVRDRLLASLKESGQKEG